jgi:hypothetical protein
MPASKNRREQGELQGAAQRVTRQLYVSAETNLQVMLEPHTMIGRRTRKGQAVRFPSLKRRPLRTGMSDNGVAVEAYLQVSRNQHATQQITRAAGYWRPDAV